MKKIAFLILLTLSGCGGGGGGGGGGGESSEPTPTPQETINGLYINKTDLGIMLIDDKQTNAAIVIADYAGDTVGYSHGHTVSDNKITANGLSIADSSTFYYLPTLDAEISINENLANVSMVVDGQNLLYSFERTSDSLPLADLVGTHTNQDDGSVWTIYADGSFVINSDCTITGKLIDEGYYYSSENTSAVACSDPSLEWNDYLGKFSTVTYQGKTKLLAAMGNESAMIWGDVDL